MTKRVLALALAGSVVLNVLNIVADKAVVLMFAHASELPVFTSPPCAVIPVGKR